MVSFAQLRREINVRYSELKGCGANKPGGGGFSSGNTCARGGGGGSSTGGSTEEHIRQTLSNPEGRSESWQVARMVAVPEDWHLETHKVANSVEQGTSRGCYDSSTAKAREGYELHVGLIVDKKEIESNKDNAVWAVSHAWNVKDGKIYDFTLGSKEAKKYHYLGEKVNSDLFPSSSLLQTYGVSKQAGSVKKS